MLLKDGYGQMVWYVAAEGGQIELLEKMWDWAKELQLKPEELRNQLWLTKHNSGKTAWHNAASAGHVELLETLWNWAKILQVKPEKLRYHVFL